MRFRLIFFCAVLPLGALPGATPARLAVQSPMAGLPLRFEANAGQWSPAVQYGARAGGYQLFLTARETVLALNGRTVAMSLAGSREAAPFTGDARMTGANYFVGRRSEWRTGVPQFARVRRTGVYPGVDVVYYGAGAQLEYDFILQPNADPNRIRMRFRGADRLSLTPEGDLLLASGDARFVQKKPVVYQTNPATGARQPVAGRYRLLARNEVGVALGDYDRARSLTIDPVLTYASLLGGGGTDGVTAVQIGPNGLLYAVGYIQRSDVVGNDASFSAAGKGGTDGFLVIVDPKQSGAESLRYFTYLGGTSDDRINALAIDGQGIAYLAGTTNSTDFPLAGTPVQESMGGADASDAFVTKLDPRLAGTDAVVYSAFLGGTVLDEGNAVAVDGNGRIYVAGTTRSENFPVTASAYAGVRWGEQDAFLAKINPDSGSPLEYSTYFGADISDEGRALAVTPNGVVYMAGNTAGSQLPQAGAQYRSEMAGAIDMFLSKWDLTKSNNASLLYTTYIGGSGVDELRAIALDADGKVLITGYTLSTDFPLAGNVIRDANQGGGDIFVARFNTNAARSEAALEWSTYFGGDGGDVAYALATGPDGSIWLTGYTLSTNFPATAAALQSQPAGGVEVFVANLDPTKAGGEAILYSTYLGDIGVNVAYGLAVAPDGTVYLGGRSAARKVIPVEAAGYQVDFGGGLSDGFLLGLGK
jgi:hypothetical protein